MPLMKTNNIDLTHITYDTKLMLVEVNCKGCPFLRVFLEDEFHTTYGCIYPEDIKDFNQNIREPYPYSGGGGKMKEERAGALPSAPSESRAADRSEVKKNDQAGTGFGETTYSPAYRVYFDPEHAIAEKIVLKYEWRSELCKKGIISGGPKNRLWPEDYEFAPIPKDFRG